MEILHIIIFEKQKLSFLRKGSGDDFKIGLKTFMRSQGTILTIKSHMRAPFN